MAISQEEKPLLIFEGENKRGALKAVIIVSEEWQGHKYKMYFRRNEKGIVFLSGSKAIGEYVSRSDPNWIPPRFLTPAIKQARAIFSNYRRREEKALSEQQTQARMI